MAVANLEILRRDCLRGFPLAGREVCEGIFSDGFAVELGDPDVEAEEHAFDLVVEAFVDCQATGGFRKKFDEGGLGAGVFLFEGHAGAKFFDGFFGDRLIGVD